MNWLMTRPGWCLSLVLFSQLAWAQAQPALFFTESENKRIEQQRQAFLNQEIVEQTQTPDLVLPVVKGELRVQAILKIKGEPFVQINDQLFRQREQKEGIHVHRIYQNRVTLTVQGRWGQARVGQSFELQNWPQAKESKVNVKN